MRIISGKSSRKRKQSSSKNPNGSADDDLFYSAEEFIAEICKPATSSNESMGAQTLEDEDPIERKGPVEKQNASDSTRCTKNTSAFKSKDRSPCDELAHESNSSSDGSSKAEILKQEYNALMAKGVRLLSMREHSTKEISSKLSSKSDSPDVLYAVIEDLISSNYLSDERFAESFVRSRKNRGHGPVKIQANLLEKGIKINLIEELLEVNSSVWYESAEQQYLKKYGSSPVDSYNTWAKRARFLQGRGFTMEHINVVVPEISYD